MKSFQNINLGNSFEKLKCDVMSQETKSEFHLNKASNNKGYWLLNGERIVAFIQNEDFEDILSLISKAKTFDKFMEENPSDFIKQP